MGGSYLAVSCERELVGYTASPFLSAFIRQFSCLQSRVHGTRAVHEHLKCVCVRACVRACVRVRACVLEVMKKMLNETLQ